jgi:hypothetical protein
MRQVSGATGAMVARGSVMGISFGADA